MPESLCSSQPQAAPQQQRECDSESDEAEIGGEHFENRWREVQAECGADCPLASLADLHWRAQVEAGHASGGGRK